MTQAEDTITKETRKVKLGGIWLESEFPKSQRCRKLIRAFGFHGYYAITLLWGELGDAHVDSLDAEDIQFAISSAIEKADVPRFLQLCCELSLLDAENGRYFSNTINSRKRKRARDSNRNVSAKTGEIKARAVLSLKSKVLDNKKEVSESDIQSVAECEYPEDFDVLTLFDWLAYKREKGQSYKFIGLQQLINRWKDRPPADFAAAVKHSTSNNYQGLFEPRSQPSPGAGFKTFGELQREKTKRVFQQLREEEERNAKGAA